VNRKGEARALADSLDQAVDGVGCERAAARGGEHKSRIGKFAAQLAQRPQLVAAQRMRARLVVLGAVDVQRGGAAELNPDYTPGR
jgi:hypothetical protein